jgi:hypothetical protein
VIAGIVEVTRLVTEEVEEAEVGTLKSPDSSAASSGERDVFEVGHSLNYKHACSTWEVNLSVQGDKLHVDAPAGSGRPPSRPNWRPISTTACGAPGRP